MGQPRGKSGFSRTEILEDIVNMATDALDPNNTNRKMTPEEVWIPIRHAINAIYNLDKLEGRPEESILDYRASSGPDAPEPAS